MKFLTVLFAAVMSATSAAPKAEVRNVRFTSPKFFISREKSDSPVQVVGRFKIEMSFAENRVRKPVVRLCCLCDIDGVLQMSRVFLDRPNTVAGMDRKEALKGMKAAGIEIKDARRREAFLENPEAFTPFLCEVGKETYASAVYGSAELEKGFFRLGRAKQMPKLLLFRLELWQNGVLVSKYESSHAGLGSYGLSEDWHVWKKYPQKFKYVDSH